jgi:antagonist of KipI
MSLRVLEPGLQSLVVDAGRPRSRSLGVPLGGAADRAAWMLGNALVGNDSGAAALEVCLAGPTLRAECDVGCAVVGAPFEVFRGWDRLPVGQTFTLRRDEVLRIGGTPSGARAYLCVCGGFREPVILGSRSSLEALKAGHELQCEASRLPGRRVAELPDDLSLSTDEETSLRFLDGPQAGLFESGAFAGQTHTVTPASNRMGLRLKGEPLRRRPGELVSEPVCPGTVQVVNDGQCIVLGVDGQTIGGYPKVAQVIAADLDRLGQLRPGQEVRFERVELEVAEELFRQRQAALHEWVTRLQTAEWFATV